MKESLQRVVTWAKEHPYLAGLIGVAVIFLAYITIKRGGGSGGASGEMPDQSETPLGSADLSNLGAPGGGGAGGGGPVDEVPPTPTPSGGGGYSGGGDEISATHYKMDQPSDFGGVDTGSYAIAQGAPVSSVALDSAHYGGFLPGEPNPSSGVKGSQVKVRKESRPASPIAAAIKAHPGLANAAKPTPKNTGIVKPSPIAAVVAKNPALAHAAKPTVLQTPAQKAGLPRLYSGTHNGVIYLMGYITGYVSKGTTGTKPASNKGASTKKR